jgi:hypothetical protein
MRCIANSFDDASYRKLRRRAYLVQEPQIAKIVAVKLALNFLRMFSEAQYSRQAEPKNKQTFQTAHTDACTDLTSERGNGINSK